MYVLFNESGWHYEDCRGVAEVGTLSGEDAAAALFLAQLMDNPSGLIQEKYDGSSWMITNDCARGKIVERAGSWQAVVAVSMVARVYLATMWHLGDWISNSEEILNCYQDDNSHAAAQPRGLDVAVLRDDTSWEWYKSTCLYPEALWWWILVFV